LAAFSSTVPNPSDCWELNTASFRLYGPPSGVRVALALARLLEIRFILVRSAVSAEELTSIELKKSMITPLKTAAGTTG
jgi:hypothetical protein